MISDKERHEVAERLRGIIYYEDDEAGMETCDGVDIIDALGLEPTGPFFADDFTRSEVERLAKLIDCQPCFLVYNPNTTAYACSVCGTPIAGCTYYRLLNGGKTYDATFYNYCPNCGAKVIKVVEHG